MKGVLKISIVLAVIVAAAYLISFYVMPSVTITNTSDTSIQTAEVKLPNGGLDFGPIEAKGQNTIHYSLEQNDGVYRYHIVLKNGDVLDGECGYVTNNEVHKRFEILVQEGNEVVCR